MTFSFKKFGLEGAALFQGLVSKNKWTEDLKRGLDVLQSGGLAVVDRSFSEVELYKLRRDLEQCDEKLDECFQTLGKKSMAHWKNQQELDHKEKEKLFTQIERLKMEKEQILAEISAQKIPIDDTVPEPAPSNIQKETSEPPSSE